RPAGHGPRDPAVHAGRRLIHDLPVPGRRSAPGNANPHGPPGTALPRGQGRREVDWVRRASHAETPSRNAFVLCTLASLREMLLIDNDSPTRIRTRASGRITSDYVSCR